jgi:hypothetical protein
MNVGLWEMSAVVLDQQSQLISIMANFAWNRGREDGQLGGR